MKTKRDREKRNSRNGAIAKKSPSLKLNLLKQLPPNPLDKKITTTHQTRREESGTTKQYDLFPDSNRFKNNNLVSRSPQKFLQFTSQTDLIRSKEQNVGQSRGKPLNLRFRNISHHNNHSKRLGDSRSLRELSTNSRAQSESGISKPKMRYEKFAFRSEKYLKLNSEVRTQTSDKQYQQSVNKLNQDIGHFKNLYYKSLTALETMEKVMKQEKQQFENQKKKYQEQIKYLRRKIEDKRINLGHLYSYKQWESEHLMPETMIVQRGEENISELSQIISRHDSHIRQRAEDLMNFYLNMNRSQYTQSSKPQQDEESLSVNSR